MNFFSLFQKTPVAGAPAPAPVPGEIRWAVDDYFFLRGVLFVKGWVFHTGGMAVAISLRLPAGDIVPLVPKPMLRPDLISVFGEVAQTAGFHAAYVLPSEPSCSEIDRMQLIFEAGDQRLEVSRPTENEHKNDAFYKSEKGFWDKINAHANPTILEIGSRARSGINRKGLFPKGSRYVGFDYLAGENVDVVGDAHELSKYVPLDSFDFVFSVVVFEHLAMPWKVALEINKVMKVGGVAMINTVQSWPVHEAPWDYFRFSDYSWDTLFNASTGFEIIDRGMGSRCVMTPAAYIPHLHECRIDWSYGYLATRCVAKKISSTALSWPVETSQVSQGHYPH